jgi:hypothetical protein
LASNTCTSREITLFGQIEDEDAVKMVQFVLEQLSEGPIDSIPGLTPPTFVRKLHGNALMAAHGAEHPGQGHAIIKQRESFSRTP